VDERGPSGESVASLASTVLDEEAARQAAQEKAREQIIFPDDLLPGVKPSSCPCAKDCAWGDG